MNLLCVKDLEILSELGTQMCMVTDGSKILLNYEGEGIVGHMKILSVKDIQGALAIEPVSRKSGIAIDPAVFAMDGS